MHRRCALYLGSALVAMMAVPQAHADLISWSYSWSSPTSTVSSDNGASSVAMGVASATAQATGNSALVAASLSAVSSASPNNPDTFTNKGYSLTLKLTDTASGVSGTVTFQGQFSGSLSAQSANISNTFLGAASATLILGANTYTVTIGPFTPPGPPGSGALGSVGAYVTATAGTGGSGGGSTGNAPEPSTLLLAGLGLSVYFGRRQRRSL